MVRATFCAGDLRGHSSLQGPPGFSPSSASTFCVTFGSYVPQLPLFYNDTPMVKYVEPAAARSSVRARGDLSFASAIYKAPGVCD